jgi:hypothetical protein
VHKGNCIWQKPVENWELAYFIIGIKDSFLHLSYLILSSSRKEYINLLCSVVFILVLQLPKTMELFTKLSHCCWLKLKSMPSWGGKRLGGNLALNCSIASILIIHKVPQDHGYVMNPGLWKHLWTNSTPVHMHCCKIVKSWILEFEKWTVKDKVRENKACRFLKHELR